jgi:hypothetical protein
LALLLRLCVITPVCLIAMKLLGRIIDSKDLAADHFGLADGEVLGPSRRQLVERFAHRREWPVLVGISSGKV